MREDDPAEAGARDRSRAACAQRPRANAIAGAYRFAHARSANGLVQETSVQLYFRKDVERLGLAPLTTRFVDVWQGMATLRDLAK